MDRNTAVDIIKLKTVFIELNKYAKHREEVLKDQLFSADNWDTVKQLQGQIQEVKRLRDLDQRIDDAIKD